ncbi:MULTISPECIES: phosphoglycerate mutase [unclassified Acidovorax]|uniref:phosphoglycerate mutase n=1 Tax=unclassified Acidovorax TaxID=2684926 RepID=UPI000BC8D66B|nr:MULTISPECIES: phosphoglycerate mutase [unclassified Acidovorax]OZA54881.1 MAG: phosphoglycerate mutase [Acidovorax sp. 17-64-282]HQS19722.1 phosphoglycerate mutase [Acidovorax defluvii]OYY25699.1 MAG: phosphoglycerate mutase [Acidovorax sp. 35-64-16]OYY83050.1 MAG: phosphoglycerate mutase [Acidovorax sp. 28-64-14]OYZ43633.1 MAG: phosphoglycerate mutase [Acidovorax sp. 16-64-162]
MSDTTSLLIPYAASTAEGCQQALQGLALPHLDRLLARLSPHTAQTDTGEETSFTPPHERALARALGLPFDDGRTPWAAWHRHQQGQPAHGQAWAFITPCQWHVSTDHITLRDPDSLGLDEAASRALLAIVAPWFAEDGIALHYDQPTRWLASGALFDGLATASLERVLLRDVRPWMPEPRAAQAARTLHRLHSEMQMLLYTHAFNDERAARGLPVVNSFWVHGTGPLPTPAPTPTTVPTVPTTLRDAALREDWRTWATAWAALDSGPVADLLRQSESGAPVQLTLCGERNAQGFHSAPRGLAQRIQGFFRPQRFMDLRNQL